MNQLPAISEFGHADPQVSMLQRSESAHYKKFLLSFFAPVTPILSFAGSVMPSRHLGRCDGHHEMVDCLGLAPGVFNGLAPGVFKIDRKKMTGQIGRSTFVSPVAHGYSASLMLSNGPYSSRFWLSIGIVCAKAVEAETIRKPVTIAIFSGVNIAISPWGG